MNNNKDITFDEAIKIADIDKVIMKRRDNGLLLSDYQIDVLNKNGIILANYSNLDTLLFDIEETLNNDYDQELDLISSQLAEYKYYKDTKKWELISFLNVCFFYFTILSWIYFICFFIFFYDVNCTITILIW